MGPFRQSTWAAVASIDHLGSHVAPHVRPPFVGAEEGQKAREEGDSSAAMDLANRCAQHARYWAVRGVGEAGVVPWVRMALEFEEFARNPQRPSEETSNSESESSEE